MQADRQITFAQALNEAVDQAMAVDPHVFIMGLGVPDPKGIFGSTLGLDKKYGAERVLDMPTSENGMTGVCIGAALAGMRPILTHQRLDFALLSMEQIVNQAANWHYMFGGKMKVPLVIRMIIGRGWGQGPQHSQSLQGWFAHIPGLKVVMPTTPYDAKGLLLASIADNNPVIFLEHRWLYGIKGPVPENLYHVPLGKARIIREGRNVTLVATSYMTLEALRAADLLMSEGIQAEVIDVRSLRPIDYETIIGSVRKTGRLVVADTGWKTVGFAAEVVAQAAENVLGELKAAPVRVSIPDSPAPTSPALAAHYYPRAVHIVAAVKKMLGQDGGSITEKLSQPLDVPDKLFAGPF
jgi:pyruvate dehydrogenase E1 component beta subunit